MKATVIGFPSKPVAPFRVSERVRMILRSTKCGAVLRARIPEELLRYLEQEAFASDQKLSGHVCRLLLAHATRQQEQSLPSESANDRRTA